MKINDLRMSLAAAETEANRIDALTDNEFQDLLCLWGTHKISDYDSCCEELRQKIVDVFEKIEKDKYSSKDEKNYQLDISIGLALFEELYPGEKLSIVEANDDDFWRYLSIKVFPDLTYFRWPKGGKFDGRINRKRFYSHTRRIWLKSLWWYIYLSWQGDYQSTIAVLNNHSGESINKLIETPGRGYRVEAFRAMMKSFSDHPEVKDMGPVTKLNNANCKTIEPNLFYGGVEAYAEELISQFSK